ncbi:hypothetical protein [Candidatus Manganitrophus noduliformans]|uniref:Uncharacterized protein n=1 Tax=Candidatus Manganitrophus noduliformans TaxID=2606439 RepID=A0A7X6IC42_9BACT|nr:hypothetical protein [Candidatus Manganitrophus noduliformans]NKE72171.1 hypothetical protein [Candidatus Manganitrophus noduliformans]
MFVANLQLVKDYWDKAARDVSSSGQELNLSPFPGKIKDLVGAEGFLQQRLEDQKRGDPTNVNTQFVDLALSLLRNG